MNKLDKAMTVLLGVLLVVLLAVLVASAPAPLPKCQEDAVIVGYGQFEKGVWTEYRCGPALDDCY